MLLSCPICEVRYFHWERHKCQPKWEVQIPEQHGKDEWVSIYAYDEEEAAKQMVERYDECDHRMLELNSTVLVVVKTERGFLKKFNCIAEASVVYYANEIEDEEGTNG